MPLGSWPDCSNACPMTPAARRIGGQCASTLVGFRMSPNSSRWRSKIGFRVGSPPSSVTSLTLGIRCSFTCGRYHGSDIRDRRQSIFHACPRAGYPSRRMAELGHREAADAFLLGAIELEDAAVADRGQRARPQRPLGHAQIEDGALACALGEVGEMPRVEAAALDRAQQLVAVRQGLVLV